MPQIITPPIRTSLLTNNGVPFSTENGDIQTAREWWLYWNRLGDQLNLAGLQTSQGAHSDRPVPDNMPDGAVYVESDRGVIYQVQDGDWVYVAGTMYGTISPDQRPVDLGPNDSGFVFTATDPLASDTGRTFVWSGTAWTETSEVLYGTHANRPTPAAAPARCIYVEADRGPLFQNQLGQWVYIAGTMWGTISPDQRPTDLGMFDAGFTFRTNVAPAREFIWSGTAWVEVTQDNTLQWVSAAGILTLTTGMADIPGLSLVLPRPGVYQVSGVIDFISADPGALFLAQLVVNGAANGIFAIFQAAGAPARATVGQHWMVSTASTNIPIKLQANKDSGAGGSLVHVHSTLSAAWVSP